MKTPALIAFVISLLVSATFAQPLAYTVTTLAGSPGNRGSVDGEGGSALFLGPRGVAIDPSGNAFVTDGHAVLKITPAGAVTTFAGSRTESGSNDGTFLAARFNSPAGVAFDAASSLLVVDTFNRTVRKISPSGLVTTFVGRVPSAAVVDGVGSNAAFYLPEGVAVAPNGLIYVTDTSAHVLRRITPEGVVSTIAGGRYVLGYADGPGEVARFNNPHGIAVDQAGNVFIADYGNHVIRKIGPAGTVSTFAGLAGAPSFADGLGAAARLYSPYGLAIDAGGMIFVGDSNAKSLRRISPAAVVATLAGAYPRNGSSDGTGSLASFFAPTNLSVDTDGRVLVLDTSNYTVRAAVPSVGVVPPLITATLANRTVPAGATTTFSLPTIGTGPLTYRWRRSGADVADVAGRISGAATPSLVIRDTQTADAGIYSLTVSGPGGSTSSTISTLTVGTANDTRLAIVPLSRTVTAGATVSWTATPASAGSYTYRWRRNGQTIYNANSATLTLPAVAVTDAGAYEVSATRSTGTLTAVVRLAVVPAAGAVAAWGGAKADLHNRVPLDLVDAVGVAAGDLHSLALRADGTVVGWGSNLMGQLTLPPGLSGVVALAAGGEHSAALRADGSVAVWGRGTEGQTAVPAVATEVVALASGARHLLALRSDGTVTAWGDNTHGQCAVPANLSAVIAVSAGRDHSLAVKTDGSVVAWGRNDLGQATPAALLTSVSAAAGGAAHHLALRLDGTLVGWGLNADGQAAPPANFTSGIALSSGANHAVALRADRNLFTWGRTSTGPATVPAGLYDAYAIAAGESHSLAVVPPVIAAPTWQGTVSATFGVTVPTTFTLSATGSPAPTFHVVGGNFPSWATLNPISGVIAGTAPDRTGSPFVFNVVAGNGADSHVTRQVTLAVDYTIPVFVAEPSPRQVVNLGQTLVINGSAHAATSYVWTRNGRTIPGAVLPELTLSGAHPVRDAGWYRVTAANSAGSVMSRVIFVNVAVPNAEIVGWGDGGNGRLPAPSGLGAISAIATSYVSDDALALRADGTVVGWGSSQNGPKGQVPVGLRNVVAITSAAHTNYALRADGTVVAWGLDPYVPPELKDVVALGERVVLHSDGRVSEWLAYGSGTRFPPTALQGLTVEISVCANLRLARTRDGTVYQWSASSSFSGDPVLGTLFGTVALAAGQEHALGLMPNGSVVAAGGRNIFGEGVVPAGISGAVTIACGPYRNIVLKSDGTVVAWGNNWAGSAVVPTGLADVVAIAANEKLTLALRSAAGSSAPVFSSPARAVFGAGGAGAFQVRASGFPSPVLSLSSGGLPAWARFEASTGMLTGSPPSNAVGVTTLTFSAQNGTASVTQTVSLVVQPRHSADYSPADGTLNLAELTRVIELYNTSIGTVRTGRYVVSASSVDGYAPDPGVTAGSIPTTPHTADLNRDGRLSLTELTRVIELFNTRAGTTRTGAYHAAASPSATEDGFAPGP